MAEQLWIMQGGNVQGPFPRERIIAWMHEGKILSSMMLSADGRTWRAAGDAADLLAPALVAPVPVPVVPVPVTAPAGKPTPPTHGTSRRTAGRGRRTGRRRAPVAPAPRPPWLPVLAIGAGLALVVVVVVVLVTQRPTNTGGSVPVRSEAVVAKAEGSVALLRDAVSSGTGFMVADGVLATNAHVVRRMLLSDMEVRFPSVSTRTFAVDRILHLDDRQDLCLLSVRANQRPLPLSSNSMPARGETLLLIGNPGVGDGIIVENAVSRGLAGSPTRIHNCDFLQISASVNPGNSGGPALDERGHVVGMVTLKATEQEAMTFALPASVIQEALTRTKMRTPEERRDLNQRHLAGAIVLRLEQAGRGYLVLMTAYLDGVRKALEDGVREVSGVQRYLPDISKQVDEVRASTGKDLDRYLGMVEGMAWMGEDAREELLDFQQIVQIFESRAMSRDVLSVINHVGEFEHLFQRFHSLSTRLRKRFGLPEES